MYAPVGKTPELADIQSCIQTRFMAECSYQKRADRTEIHRFIYKGVSKLKTTGVVRKLDELGRITLPIELRRSLNLDPKDELEIFVEDDQIILRKCESGDIFTGGTEDLIEYEGKTVSKHSIVEMAKIAGLSVTE